MARKRVVAIDIGSESAKLVELEHSAGGVRLTNAAVVQYLSADDRLQVSRSLKELLDAVDGLSGGRGLFSVFSWHRSEVVLALPRALVSTKRLSNLPSASDDQLSNIVAIAAETELPFRIEESVFTYHDVRRTPESTSVELISTRRESVTNYLDLLEELGVSVSAVMPSMIAIAEVAMRSGVTKPTFVVDIGAGQTDFCFIEGGRLRFSRSFRLGGDQLTDQVSQALEIEGEAAVQAKRHLSADEAPVMTWSTRLVDEILRSITAARAHVEPASAAGAPEPGGPAISGVQEAEAEIWLSGGGSRIADLASVCEAGLNIPTRLWNPVSSIAGRTDFEIQPMRSEVQGILDEWGDTLAVSLGTALNSLEASGDVSLLPKEAVETLTQTTRQRQVFAVGGLGALLVGGLILGGYTLQATQNSKHELVEAELAAQAPSLAAAQAQLGRELALTEMLTHNPSPLDILHVLSEAFRDRKKVAWIDFDIKNLTEVGKARVTFDLEGSSHEELNELIAELERSGVFTNVRPGEATMISQNRKEIFQMQVRCSLKSSAVQAFAKKRYVVPGPSGMDQKK